MTQANAASPPLKIWCAASAKQRKQYLEAAASLHVLEHVASGSIFHRNGQVVGREEDLLELDDVGMAEVAMTNNLALDMLGNFVATLQQQMSSAQKKADTVVICVPHVAEKAL